jgi:hypothetical protein
MNEQPPKSPDSDIWQKALLVYATTPKTLPEIIANREAIHKALKESRMRRTVRVKSKLP